MKIIDYYNFAELCTERSNYIDILNIISGHIIKQQYFDTNDIFDDIELHIMSSKNNVIIIKACLTNLDNNLKSLDKSNIKDKLKKLITKYRLLSNNEIARLIIKIFKKC